MATAQLIERLLDETEDGTAVMEALRILLDDATLEPDAEPLSVADTASLTRLSPHTLRYYEREGAGAPGADRVGLPRVFRTGPTPTGVPHQNACVRHDHERPQALRRGSSRAARRPTPSGARSCSSKGHASNASSASCSWHWKRPSSRSASTADILRGEYASPAGMPVSRLVRDRWDLNSMFDII